MIILSMVIVSLTAFGLVLVYFPAMAVHRLDWMEREVELAYRASLARRLDPTAALLQRIQGAVMGHGRRIVFAEGEEPSVIRAAFSFQTQELGKAILIGREERVKRTMRQVGVPEDALEIVNAALSDRNPDYFDYLYESN